MLTDGLLGLVVWGLGAVAPLDPRLMLEADEESPAPPPPVVYTLTADAAKAPSEETVTRIYRVKYGHGAALRDVLEAMGTPLTKVIFQESLNAIVVEEAKSRIDRLLALLEQLDVYRPQVLVQAKVVEFTEDADFEMEWAHTFTNLNSSGKPLLQDSSIALKTPGSNPSTNEGLLMKLQPLNLDFGKLDELLRLLVSQGRARILSAPNVVVDRGTEASIITGEELPIQSSQIVGGAISTTTQFKKVGVKLRVTPTHITDQNVRLSINPEVSTVSGYTPGPGGTATPIVAIRSTSTDLSVKDGEVITIGGLLRSEERRLERKVPLLGDLPLLGMLFSSVRTQSVKTHLMFFLEITVLKEGVAHQPRVFPPDRPAKAVDDEIQRLAPK